MAVPSSSGAKSWDSCTLVCPSLAQTRCAPEGEAEQGAREATLQAAAKVQVGPECVGELAQQVGLGEVELEARLRRADAWQVTRVRVKQDEVLPRHKAAHQQQGQVLQIWRGDGCAAESSS